MSYIFLFQINIENHTIISLKKNHQKCQVIMFFSNIMVRNIIWYKLKTFLFSMKESYLPGHNVLSQVLPVLQKKEFGQLVQHIHSLS